MKPLVVTEPHRAEKMDLFRALIRQLGKLQQLCKSNNVECPHNRPLYSMRNVISGLDSEATYLQQTDFEIVGNLFCSSNARPPLHNKHMAVLRSLYWTHSKTQRNRLADWCRPSVSRPHVSRPSERERALVSCASVILADFLLGGLVELSQKDIYLRRTCGSISGGDFGQQCHRHR